MDSPPEHLHPHRHLRIKAGAAMATALVGLAVVVSACSSGSSSPGVASAGKDPSGHSTTNDTSNTHSLVGYSKCMQTHGVPSFPDPNSKGQLTVSGSNGSALDPQGPVYAHAQSVCAKDLPQPTPAQQAANSKRALKMSECMRAHGIKDFPDPDAQGKLTLKSGPDSDLNPNDPQFQAASNACASDGSGGPKIHVGAPGGATTNSGSTSGGFSQTITGG
jgi:hypothetical protein